MNAVPATEHQIQQAILNYLQYKGCKVKRNNSGKIQVGEGRSRRMINVGEAGWPDIIGLTPQGIFLGIEVKKPGNKVTPLQETHLNDIRLHNGLAFVATSIDDVERGLDGYL